MNDNKSTENKVSQTGQLLRYLGVGSLVLGATVRLFQSWANFSELSKYYSFLGFELLLLVLAAGYQFLWKEPKTARTFWGLSLCGVTALFSLFGGVIHDLGLLLVPLNFTVILASLATFGALSCLSGRSQLVSSVLFLFSNSLFLLQHRDPASSMLMILAQLGFVTLSYQSLKESRLAQRILQLAPMVLLVRAYLYPTTLSLHAFASGLAGAVVFWNALKHSGERAQVRYILGSFLMISGWHLYSFDAVKDFNLSSSQWVQILFWGDAVLFYILSILARESNKGFRFVLGLATALGTLLLLGWDLSFFEILAGLAVTATAAAVGYKEKDASLFLMAVPSLGIMACRMVGLAFVQVDLTPWVILSALGITLVIVASLFEKYKSIVVSQLKELKQHFLDAQ